RLVACRPFLRHDGVLLVSINDTEVHNLRRLLDELFGEENFVAQIVWQRSKRGDAKLIATVHEYVLCYVRDRNAAMAAGLWRRKKEGVDEVLAHYRELCRQYGSDHESIRAAMRK